jgi:hypothetical protein
MTVGQQLQQARTARKLSFKDVTAVTKIQPWILDALESDRLPELMSPVYVKGFLSTYARYLKLDAAPLVAGLQWPQPASVPGVVPQQEELPSAPAPAPVIPAPPPPQIIEGPVAPPAPVIHPAPVMARQAEPVAPPAAPAEAPVAPPDALEPTREPAAVRPVPPPRRMPARTPRPAARLTVPTLKLPAFKMPAVRLPRVQLPKITMPKFSLPRIELPRVTMPTLPSFRMPKIQLPKFSLPRLTLPDFELPTLRLPEMRLPRVRMPRIPAPVLFRVAQAAAAVGVIAAIVAVRPMQYVKKLPWPNVIIPKVAKADPQPDSAAQPAEEAPAGAVQLARTPEASAIKIQVAPPVEEQPAKPEPVQTAKATEAPAAAAPKLQADEAPAEMARPSRRAERRARQAQAVPGRLEAPSRRADRPERRDAEPSRQAAEAPAKPAAARVAAASIAPIGDALKPRMPDAPPPVSAGPLKLVITASRPTWIKVRADGKLLSQQRLARGANEQWTATKQFEIIVSRPAQVDVILNGQSISPLAMAHRGRLLITHRGVTELPEGP